MKLFRGLATEVDPHWADHLLDSGVIPSFRGGYLGISALRNSDVLTAVSIVSGDVSRFPLVITDSSTDEVVDLANIEYLMNTKVNKRLSAYQWKFSMMVNAILTGNAYSRIVRDPITNEPAMFEFYAHHRRRWTQATPITSSTVSRLTILACKKYVDLRTSFTGSFSHTTQLWGAHRCCRLVMKLDCRSQAFQRYRSSSRAA